jgi:hypothetical protein
MIERASIKGATQHCGYLSADIHGPTASRVRGLGVGEWRKPIHGTALYVAGDGKTPLAQVRTLGILMPLKDRRYILKINGVMFTRTLALVSKAHPIRSDLAPYDTMKEAQRAGDELIRRMMESGA